MGGKGSGRVRKNAQAVVLVCKACGKNFKSKSPWLSFCPVCRDKRKRDQIRASHERLREVRKTRKPATDPRVACGYCGRPALKGEKYCSRCLKEGLNYLHSEFGATRESSTKRVRPAQHVKVKAGWRGRPINGTKCIEPRVAVD